MNRIYTKFFLHLSLIFAFALCACTDSIIYSDEERIGEGTANVSASVTFKSFSSALSRADGNILDGLSRVTVYVYNKDNKLVGEPHVFTPGTGGLTVTQSNEEAPEDAVNPDDAVKTAVGEFKMNLPYGRYRVFVVGNADMSQYTIDDVATPDLLKEKTFDWNSDTPGANNQMFGYFSTQAPGTIQATNFVDGSLQAPEIIINKSNLTLSAWLVRLASKVTVAFDGSGLYENIQIYIKDVQIKDIPVSCPLGLTNTPSDDSELIPTGETIYYYDRTKYPDGPSRDQFEVSTYKNFISAGRPSLLDDEGKPVNAHTHNAPALFFYENNQGVGKDKAQDAVDNSTIGEDNFGNGNPDGVMDFPNGNDPKDRAHKDAKPYGTYIEVHAYYISRYEGEQGQGEIIYRFMLGKDIKNNYEALRNYHYKLTLKFKGLANNPDWHIVYEQEKYEIEAPNPHYISYLYNRKMMLPVEITTGSGELIELKADIVSNGWAPIDVESQYIYTSGDQPTASDYSKYWLFDNAMDKPTIYPWNGFLSLRDVGTNTNITQETGPFTVNSNQTHYETERLGQQNYTDFSPSTDDLRTCQDKGVPHVALKTDGGNNIYTVSIPFWTRAKNLISQTAYTGNNPFVAYRREAQVKLTATIRETNGTTRVIQTGLDAATGNSAENVIIQQERRIVNPKGIYRSANNSDPFDVILMIQPREESTQFTPQISDGPWRAYVFRDTKRGTGTGDFNQENGTIQLLPHPDYPGALTTGTITINDNFNRTRTYETIEGKGGSYIAFRVKFNGTASGSNNNHAIIRVEYQNYTCFHVIFVRQGYEPEALTTGGPKWCIGNNITRDNIAVDPRDEGSLFKLGNFSQPIAANNNVNGNIPGRDGYWVNVTPDNFALNAAGTKQLTLATGGSSTWDNITYQTTTSATTKTFFEGSFNGRHVATYDEWQTLYSNDQNESMEQGFGILYGDGATKCQTDINEAEGYMTHLNKPERGMRGCFAYSYTNGKNVFFPIGASGYGHRKASTNNYSGVLRYNCNARWGYFNTVVDAYPNGVNDCPLFFDIFRRNGAIYWFQRPSGTGGTSIVAWDINYFTFDFSSLTSYNTGEGADAVFLRMVAE